MTDWVMTVVDTVGIQPYVFSSNNLKHIVGASQLVHEATHDWVYGCLVDVGKTNVDRQGKMFDDQRIEEPDHGLTSELVYAGGGNAVILFKDRQDARRFTNGLTEKALMDAPGLQVVVVHQPFAWGDSLADVRCEAFKALDRKKRDRRQSSPLLGLSVTADCQFTGLPATAVHTETGLLATPAQVKTLVTRRVSAEVNAKGDAFERAQKRLRELSGREYSYVQDFDDFGDKGESSYIAVVHTDGNGMGRRIEALEKGVAGASPRAYIQAMRAFSKSVQEAAEAAIRATIDRLAPPDDNENEIKIGGVVSVRDNKLPFRPIVFGGDDTTFACDGRLGLTLTEFYLGQLTEQPLSDGRPLTARAGIAVVNSHYPFARAYGLAEELAKSAKERIKKIKDERRVEVTAMDWHFAVSGHVLDLKAIRKREYSVKAGDLVMRPVALDGGDDWRTWKVFTDMMCDFQGKEWKGRRNKLKALRGALRTGESGVQKFVQAAGTLPAIADQPEAANQGWIDKRCAYYDAVEALDFYVPLPERATGGDA